MAGKIEAVRGPCGAPGRRDGGRCARGGGHRRHLPGGERAGQPALGAGRSTTSRSIIGADDNTGITISDGASGALPKAPMFVATR